MSSVKINNDLFLGKEELNRFRQFLDESGYRRFIGLMTKSFGVVKNFRDGSFDSFKVETGASGQIKILGNSFAVDENLNLIHNPTDINFNIPNDSSWYWVKINHTKTNLEQGTVSLASDGSLSGVNTKFSEVLRGSPNYPSRLRLYSIDSNGFYTQFEGEAEVVSVLSDTSAFIHLYSGSLPGTMRYSVVGTFTPSIVVPEGSKMIFEYDYVTIELVPEITEDVPPVKNTDEYYIARVKNSGGTVTINDKRTDVWCLDIACDIVKDAYYLGDPELDDSWKITTDNGKLILGRKESGEWVSKFVIPNDK